MRPPLRYTASGSAVSAAAACALEKNAAVRAFCSETSMPNIGASRVRTMPRMTPFESTTEIVTRAGAPSGRRICARARFAVRAAPRKNLAHFVRRERPARLRTGDAEESARRSPSRRARTHRAPGIVERVRPDAGRRLPERRARLDHGRRRSSRSLQSARRRCR